MVLLVRFRLKTVESIAVTPSAYLTVHVRVPHYAVVRPRELVTSASVQLRTFAASLMLYVKAGVAIGNFVVSTFKVSVRQGLVTKILKICVFKT